MHCNVDGDVFGLPHSCSLREKYEWIDMELNEYDINYLSDKCISVFGAGNIGKNVIKKLHANKLKVNAVIVSTLDRNQSSVDGIPVIPVDKTDTKCKNGVILIAVSNLYRQSVADILQKNGISNFIFLYKSKN